MNSYISALLHTDDLVVLFLNKEDLQEKLSRLENCCNEWVLDINLKKTKDNDF